MRKLTIVVGLGAFPVTIVGGPEIEDEVPRPSRVEAHAKKKSFGAKCSQHYRSGSLLPASPAHTAAGHEGSRPRDKGECVGFASICPTKHGIERCWHAPRACVLCIASRVPARWGGNEKRIGVVSGDLRRA